MSMASKTRSSRSIHPVFGDAPVSVRDYFSQVLEEGEGWKISIPGWPDELSPSLERFMSIRGILVDTEHGWGIKIDGDTWSVIETNSDDFEVSDMELEPTDASQHVGFQGVTKKGKKRVHSEMNPPSPMDFPVSDRPLKRVAGIMAGVRSGTEQSNSDPTFPCSMSGTEKLTLGELGAPSAAITVNYASLESESGSLNVELNNGVPPTLVYGFVGSFDVAKKTATMTVRHSFRGNKFPLRYVSTADGFQPVITCKRDPKKDPKKPGYPILLPLAVELVVAVASSNEEIEVVSVFDYLAEMYEEPAKIPEDQEALNDITKATYDACEEYVEPKARPKIKDYVGALKDRFHIPVAPAAAAVVAAAAAAATVRAADLDDDILVEITRALDEVYSSDGVTSEQVVAALWKAKTPHFELTRLGKAWYAVYHTKPEHTVNRFVSDLYAGCGKPSANDLAVCCFETGAYTAHEATEGLRSIKAFTEEQIEAAIQQKNAYGGQPFDLVFNGGALDFADDDKFNQMKDGDFSIEAKVQADGQTPSGNAYIVYRCASTSIGYLLWADPQGHLHIYTGDQNGNSAELFTPHKTDVFDGRDHLVVVVRSESGKKLEIFIDGKSVAQKPSDTPINVATPKGTHFLLGAPKGSESFPGLMQFARLWKRAISPGEINNHIGQPPEEDPDLIEWWDFKAGDTKGGKLIDGARLQFHPGD